MVTNAHEFLILRFCFHANSPLRIVALLALVLLLAACGGGPDRAGNESARNDKPLPRIAVSNSWLECCVRDLMGAGCEPVRVCPPGACPGHFDIRPGDVNAFQDCRLIFLFDFQKSLGEQLRALFPDSLNTVIIEGPRGLCVPSSYRAACEAVHATLLTHHPERRPALDAALASIGERMAALEKDIPAQIQSAGLKGVAVVCSGHQEAFCRWLGLNPIAAYSGPESASPARIEALLEKGKSAGVRFVVANLQEGAQAGEALALQLGAALVVFSNFPSMTGDETSIDALVRSNVGRLLIAAENSE